MPPNKKDNPSYNQEDLAKKFKILKSQVCKILKENDKWLSIDISNKEFKNQKWNRSAKFPEVETALYLLMRQALSSNLIITGDIVEAYDLAQEGNSNMMPIDILDTITFVNTIIDNNIDKITLKIQDIINKLNLEDPITTERFIYIDNEIPIEPLSEDNIIATIISKEDDKLEIDVISNKNALNSLEKIIQYCKNFSDDVSIDYEELKVLNTLKSKINKLI
ncbi:5642_t:CDS:2 [Funneliformis geosporum]|nr:5642_t:CDS:2 [Funneliformis geosporum]